MINSNLSGLYKMMVMMGERETARYVWSAILYMVFAIHSFISISYAISIGTIPGVLDLGEVERGQKIYAEYYITSTLSHPMKVSFFYMPPHATIMEQDKTRRNGGYNFIPAEASEEDIRGWIEIQDKSMIINPDDYRVIKLKDGTTVKYNQKLRFLIKIPKDAEPGYHAGAISISPTRENREGRGTSVATIGITRPMFVFRVSGNAVRRAKVIGVEAKRLSKTKVRIDVLVKNDGTVTMTTYVDKVHIYNDFGYDVGNIITRTARKIKPGEITVVSAIWNDKKGIKSGVYNVDVGISYITGKADYTGTIKVTDEIYVPKEGEVVKEEKRSIPWWFLLIIMGLIALYIYWKM